MKTAHFNRFSVNLHDDAVKECSRPGSCDSAVAFWAKKTERSHLCTPEALAAELKEYGAWDAEQLMNDDANWERIVWLAAGNAKEDARQHGGDYPNGCGESDCEICV